MSTKVSNLPRILSVDDNGLLLIALDGQSVAITQANYFQQFGTTGTIVQDGDPAATPVLDPQGTVNNIRNLSNGSGVKSSVNAQNGITLAHNFTVNAIGAPLMLNQTFLSPTFASLVEGDGIDISIDGNTIVVSATGALPATKTVPINAESDFPTAVSNVITLEPFTTYLISNDVTTASRFIQQDCTSVVSHSLLGPKLTSTNAGTMFTAVDSNVLLANCRFDCPNGKFHDWSQDVTAGLQGHISNVIVDSCDTFGDLDNLFSITIDNVFCPSVTTTGQTLTGTGWGSISITRFALVSASATFKGIDLGSAISINIELDNLIFQNPTAGSFGVSGLVSSGNLPAGSLATLTNSTFDGAIVALENITSKDIRWDMDKNTDIQPTRVDALISMQNNVTPTAVAGASTDGSNAALVDGAWTVNETSKMTGTTAGRVTLDSEVDERLPVTGHVSVEPVSGPAIVINAYIAVDGVVITDSRSPGTAAPGSPASITLPWQNTYTAITGFTEIYLENTASGVSILAASGKQVVN